MMKVISETTGRYYEDPPAVRILFSSPRYAWLWVALRGWLGYQWIEAASHKIGDAAWVQSGIAIRAFWEKAVGFSGMGKPPASLDWYRHFLQWLLNVHAETLMGKVIAYGELTVGIALVLGALVGLAAFFGAFMNWNYLMAGSVSTNPLLIVAAVLLIVAWKVGGYFGVDRYLLLRLWKPWRLERLGPVRRAQGAL
jgi:thiosulfate dehydrogenase [quinone] large subunit